MKKIHARTTLVSVLILCLMGFTQYSAAHGKHWGESNKQDDESTPEVTYTPEDSLPDYPVAPSGEVYLLPTAERIILHQENHDYQPVVTATLPPIYDEPRMDSLEDFVLHKEDLVVVNPAPDEYLWIMEGQRHGYNNLTLVMTNTITGNGAPLHTHVGEESHVLLKGKMQYVLGDQTFTVEAPYIINIPSMVPHAFMNISDEPAQLVGIFPESNHWEYDVLDADVFPESANAATDNTATHSYHSKKHHKHHNHFSDHYYSDDWYSEGKRIRRMNAYRESEKHD